MSNGDSLRRITGTMDYETRSTTALLRCGRCNQSKPEDAFGVARSRPTGRHSWCRECRRSYQRDRYASNPEPQKSASRRYNEAHRDAIRARRESQIDEARAAGRRAYAAAMADPAKREAYNEYHRRYRAENRERISAISRASHERTKSTHPERIAAKRRRRYEREVAAGTVNEVLKLAVLERYGGLCYLCDGTATEFDHVQPITSDDVTSLENLRPVCKPCNVRKASTWPIDLDELRARIRAERSR